MNFDDVFYYYVKQARERKLHLMDKLMDEWNPHKNWINHEDFLTNSYIFTCEDCGLVVKYDSRTFNGFEKVFQTGCLISVEDLDNKLMEVR